MKPRPITLGDLYTEGLRVSKNHIKGELRSKGFKLSSFSSAELTGAGEGISPAQSGSLDWPSTRIAGLVAPLFRTQNICTKNGGR
jgi:hypothetical protein